MNKKVRVLVLVILSLACYFLYSHSSRSGVENWLMTASLKIRETLRLFDF